MDEPNRRVRQIPHHSSELDALSHEYPLDVLLIADSRTSGTTAPSRQPTEPLDMESVVRKLIALLSEQSQP